MPVAQHGGIDETEKVCFWGQILLFGKKTAIRITRWHRQNAKPNNFSPPFLGRLQNKNKQLNEILELISGWSYYAYFQQVVAEVDVEY